MNILKINLPLKILLLILAINISCSTTKKIEHELVNQSEINNYFRGLVVYNPKTNKELILR